MFSHLEANENKIETGAFTQNWVKFVFFKVIVFFRLPLRCFIKAKVYLDRTDK